MATAFVVKPSDVTGTDEDIIVTYDLVYRGAEVGAGRGYDLSHLTVTYTPTDTLAQMRTKLVNAILAEAGVLGYGLTAARIILPSYQRGA